MRVSPVLQLVPAALCVIAAGMIYRQTLVCAAGSGWRRHAAASIPSVYTLFLLLIWVLPILLQRYTRVRLARIREHSRCRELEVTAHQPAWRIRDNMNPFVNNSESIRLKTYTWVLRPIAWFAIAYMVNIIFHEGAHAVTAYALDFHSTLFNFWVCDDEVQAVG